MWIEILKRTSIQGVTVLPGQVVEATDRDGRYLIGAGKAQAAELNPVAAEQPSQPIPRKRNGRTRVLAGQAPALHPAGNDDDHCNR